MSERGCAGVFVRDGRLRSGWRVALYLAGYLAIVLLFQTPILLAYVGYLYLGGATSATALLERLQPDRLPLGLVLALKGGEIAALLPLTILFARFLDRRALRDLGVRATRGWAAQAAWGAGAAAVQMAAIVAVAWAAGWVKVQLPAPGAWGPLALRGVGALLLFVLVAVGEELLFRGYVQTNLQEGAGPAAAILLTSLAFALFHGLNPGVGPLALLNIALAGVVLGVGRRVSGSLWFPVAYHWSWNWVQGGLFALPVSGVYYAGWIAVTDLGAATGWTGGAFGPEGGWLATIALLASLPALWLWGRSKTNAQ